MTDTLHVRRLTPGAKLRLIAEILATYPSALRLVRSNDLEGMVARARDVPRPRPHEVAPELEHSFAKQVGVAVTRTLHVLPTDSRCLVRSIVLTRLLSRRAIPSRLVIGVTPGADFAAHAWVEHDDQPVLPPGMHARLHEL
jgi:Transglutaminase-like superfamily